jgi:HK97 family phage major capsid protein
MAEVQTIQNPTLQRRATINNQAINQEARTVEVAFSDETPIEDWPGQFLILDHSEGAAQLERLNDGAPVLVNHTPSLHVGVVERAWIGTDRKGRALLRFGKGALANEVFEDVVSGIRRHISVGANITGDIIERTEGDKVYYVVTGWEASEISFASIPANHNLGIGRTKGPDEPPTKRVKIMDNETPNSGPSKADIERARKEGATSQIDRVKQILEVGEEFECLDLAREAITTGQTMEEFSRKAVVAYHERKNAELERAANPTNGKPLTAIGMTEQEAKRFSVTRALNAVFAKDWTGAEFELECSQEIERVMGREARGVFIPHEVQTRSYVQREMTTGGVATGAEMVGTRHSPENFIEQLRNSVVSINAGARLLTGLTQNLAIPKKTSGATFAWIAESAAATLTDLGTGSVTLSPKTVAGGVRATRRMMKQALPAIDDLIMQDLVEGAAEAIDLGILQGTGAANQPTGVFNTASVNTQAIVAAGNPTLAEAVGFETNVATDNALRGNLSYITTSAVVGNMKLRALDAGSGRFLIDPVSGGGLLGYPVRQTNAITANRIMFGNWAEVLVGMWGVLDLRPDPYTGADEDAMIIRAFQDIDVAVRHPESFCVSA